MQNSNVPTQSVIKLMQIIRYLGESVSPVRLQQVAADTNMPQSTVLRYLNTLMQAGYVYQDALSERYALTWRICEIGENVRTHSSLRQLSGTLVGELSAELGLGVAIVIENGGFCMYLDCVYEPSSVGQTLQRIGSRTPMNSTSSGKILLSRFSTDQLDKLIAENGLPALTDRTITEKDVLIREVELSRQRGYAIDDEECEVGLRCISVPIFDYHNEIAAAICCFGSENKMTDDIMQSVVLPRLRAVAAEISFRMGSGVLARSFE